MKRIPPLPARSGFTSLIDVAFLVLIFFMALPMRRLDEKLKAELPTGVGEQSWEAKQPDIVRLTVRNRGGEALYGLGDRSARDPRAFAGALRSLGPERTYRIDSSPDVAWQAVVRLVDELTGLKLRKVQFSGARRR